MIRDPSDGSVRKPEKPQVSGLPTAEAPEKREERQRLERSRQWLDRYHAQKSAISPPLDKAIQDELDHPPSDIMKDE